jgi:hypothetical protein
MRHKLRLRKSDYRGEMWLLPLMREPMAMSARMTMTTKVIEIIECQGRVED